MTRLEKIEENFRMGLITLEEADRAIEREKELAGMVNDSLQRMEDNGEKNVYAIYGGARIAYDAVHFKGDIDRFLGLLKNCVKIAAFYGVEPLEAAKKFCHLCMVDPMLYGISG